MRAASSALDRPAARAVAAAVALAALGLSGWLLYIDNRQDPALAACIAKRTAAIAGARDKGNLPAEVAKRFLARVRASCEAEARAGQPPPR
jgi:hypothetical protein